MSDALATSMKKVQDEAKEKEEQTKDQAFIDDYQELAKKHKRELGAKLNFAPNGIVPGFTIVRSPIKDEPQIITPNQDSKA